MLICHEHKKEMVAIYDWNCSLAKQQAKVREEIKEIIC